MSNSSTPVREDDVRDMDEQNPPEAESSFGDILNQFEQSHAHDAQADKGASATVSATVVAVSADSVIFDVGQKTEGDLPLEALADEQGPIPVKPGDVVQVSVGSRNSEGYW